MTKYPWYFLIGAVLAACGVSLAIFHPGPAILFFVPLPMTYAAALAGSCFWLRTRTTTGRERIFWWLWAWGCWVSALAGLFAFFALSESSRLNVQFSGLAFTFLPQVLFMAALVMQPENTEGRLRDPVVRYEAALVALWWVYLYALIISPWRWVLPSRHQYLLSFARLHELQNVSAALWLLALWLVTKGSWRRVYGRMTGAFVLLALSGDLFYRAGSARRWLPAMIFQALIVAAFLWLSQSARVPASGRPGAEPRRATPSLGTGAWLASITAIGIPLLAFWFSLFSVAPQPVQRFRLLISFATLVAAALLLYRWQNVAESQRDRLVRGLETSVHELRRLQGHFAEAEKLASLGQLAAGAAHEINNPVAAMLGYSELLQSDPSAPPRVQEFGRKIGEQARRIRNLVKDLLSLAEPETRQAETIDVSVPLRGALELRRTSAGRRPPDLALRTSKDSFLVRGDREKLLQVFYRLLLAITENGDEAGGEIRLAAANDGERVMVEFIGRPRASSTPSTTAPQPYTAQTAQQGRQLSLSVCYAIVREHGGAIVRETRMDGGKIFRVELPSAPACRPLPSAVC